MATTEELLKLDLRARLKLIESLPVPDDLRQLLDRRMKAYRANPDAGSSWPEVRERIVATTTDPALWPR